MPAGLGIGYSTVVDGSRPGEQAVYFVPTNTPGARPVFTDYCGT